MMHIRKYAHLQTETLLGFSVLLVRAVLIDPGGDGEIGVVSAYVGFRRGSYSIDAVAQTITKRSEIGRTRSCREEEEEVG
jgi:hypothetical protein